MKIGLDQRYIVQGLGLIEDIWKAWSNMIKGRALYQSVIQTLELVAHHQSTW